MLPDRSIVREGDHLISYIRRDKRGHFHPCPPDSADLIKVVYDDGRAEFYVPRKQPIAPPEKSAS